ncbi:MAG TPA: TonB-dependent receptor [Gemmatimonadota bacterium]|nr:TonB-dependent receptor [Gemmatimonadota bacterium]
MIDLALVAAIALGGAAGDGTVQGTIRSDRNEPVAGVRVEVPAANILTWSDSTGAYAIEGLEPGTYEIRFDRFAYDPLTLTVTVPERGAIELDVELRTRFVLLPPISVIASIGGARGDPRPSSLFRSNGLPEVGSREVPAERIWSSPLAPHPDVLAVLRAVPGIDMAEESPTQVHVRGGSADQNLVLLDGVPVYSPNHTSGVLGAITPDAVSRLHVHAGVLPARYGGRLSSVVDVETRTPGRAGVRIRGGAGVPDIRAAVEAPLPRGLGTILLGGRSTVQDLIEGGPFSRVEASGFDDILGKGSLDVAGGTLAVLSFHSDNWLSSPAGDGGRVPSDAAGDMESEPADVPEIEPDTHNRVRWSSGTDALSWLRSSDERSETELRLWRAAARSDVEWGSMQDRHRMKSSLEHWGVSGDLAWKASSSVGRAGLAVEWLSSAYETESPDAGLAPRPARAASAAAADPRFAGRPWIVSTYLEHRWIPRDRWMISNGMRAVHVEGHGLELEPRFSAHYRPGDTWTVSGGFARVHQYVQSLANEESLLNAAYSVEPLVAAGSSGVPVARSDQVTAALEARLTGPLTLTLDGYARWLDDLVLVAPATDGPFATIGFARGEGRADGLGAALVYRGERVDAEAIAEWSQVRRSAGGVTYHPRLERSRSLAVAAAWRVTQATSLRTAFQAAAGPPTSRLESGFEWKVFDLLSGEVEFVGAPIRAPGKLNADRVPAYVRWDLGIRKRWHYTGPGPEGSITTYLDVINVLGRKNALGYQLGPTGSDLQVLTLRPASILFGIEWSF